VAPSASASTPGFRGYRLAQSFVDKGPFRDGAPLRVGAIVAGLRVRPDASGLRLAETVSDPPLQAGVPLPEAQGGGLLFWNNSALYTADSFLGELKPVLDIGFRPEHVSFGPGFALVRSGDGRRLAIDLRTGSRAPILPPLLVDIASTADGSALALLEGGACASSNDGGKSYSPVTLPTGTHALSVRERNGSLLAQLSNGLSLKLEKGRPAQLESEPPETKPRLPGDALWPLAVPPLEEALRFGVPIGEQFAGVAVAGGVATVNLRTGELVQMTRALVPSELSCRTLEASGGLLLACSSRARGSLVLSDVFGEHPQIQATFPAGVELDFAAGVLVAAARCDGRLKPGAVCVRDEQGAFHDFDISAQLAKLEQIVVSPNPPRKVLEKPTVVRWIPKQGGGAVALLRGPPAQESHTDSISGLLDAESGRFVPFAQDMPRGVLEDTRTAEAWLGLDWFASRDGRVRGWLPSAAISIDSGGRIEPSVFAFSSLAGAGAHALSFDHGRRVFQSADWGRSWVETLAPPGSASGAKTVHGARCSGVGCVLGPWLRVGWDAEVPAELARSQVAPAPAGMPRAALPFLSCTQLAPPAMSAAAPGKPDADVDGPPHVAGFGVSPGMLAGAAEYQAALNWSTTQPPSGSAFSLGLRGGMVAQKPVLAAEQAVPPANWPGFGQIKRFSFVNAFDPSARLHAATITWGALFAAARASGAESPSLDVDSTESATALPVLGPSPGQAEGLLLTDSWPVWLHESGSAEAVSLGHTDAEPISAIASAAHTLLVLTADTDGTLEVREIKAGRSRRLFQWPGLGEAFYAGNADALAVNTQGALALLHTPSADEPATTADPAWLFHPDGSISAVAPWSRLFTADAPECKPASSDYRAVFQTSRAWLGVVISSKPVPEDSLDAGMFAVLRVNAERWCLEAIELASDGIERADNAYTTRLSARFVGPHPTAASLGFAPGFELRQPLSCSLNGSH
jgi:hypothetical protein